ncbi:hypothetical protein DMC47_01830 [Nostoc sp. 3335mG]|nr:hypothetical protein DMC47_01830 [Nostoc sp. 3335mG]
MVFDLGRAMRKKAEHETARLMDFDFRQRVRATRLFLERHGLDITMSADLVARLDERAALDRLAHLAGVPIDTAATRYAETRATARAQLVAALGDPTPHRLA